MARILVVEDVRSSREFVVRWLRQRGHAVQEANDGEQGLALVRAHPPDLILTDLEMPRLDGLGFLRAVHAEQPECPAIVLSAHEDLTHVLGAIRQGLIFDYLVKPVDGALFEVAVRRGLDIHTLRTKARELDQVQAMRQLAMTAGDQILNPLNVISIVIHQLRTNPTPATVALTVQKLETMSARISETITRMSRIVRYAPEWVVGDLWQINLDAATEAKREPSDSLSPAPPPSPPALSDAE